jgi:hypothetical protein
LHFTRLPALSLHFEDNGKILARSTTHGVGALLPPIAVGVLAFCGEPRTREQVEQAFGAAGGQLFDGLCQVGLLVHPDGVEATPAFFNNFASIDIHRRMLADQPRLAAYQAAIEEVVHVGHHVIDAGTGTGILACMAARAGAELVHAVDNSEILTLTRQVVSRSGLEGQVRCERSEIMKFRCDIPVDVILTETFGAFALAEGSAPDIQACSKHNLKPGGVVIPYAISLYFAPTDDKSLYEQTFGPFEQVQQAEMGPLIDAAKQRAITLEVPPESLLCPGAQAWHLTYPDVFPNAASELQFTVDRETTLTGFVGWFVLHLSPSHDLDTGPDAPQTHWHQVYFPVENHPVEKGETLACEALLSEPPEDPRGLEVTLTIRTKHATNRHFFRVR